jgi:hypothetical protein
MNMIGHQAVAHQGNAPQPNILPQQIQVYLPICIAIQNETPSVSTLRYMMRNIDRDHSSENGPHHELIRNTF